MSIVVELAGADNDGHVHRPHVHTRGHHAALLTLTQDFLQFQPVPKPFLNDTNGQDMAQDVSFGSIPSILHDGGSSSSAKTGTADTDTANSLEDSGAVDFTTTVSVGMTVENTNDNTYARVDSVDSNIKLTLSDIGDGADIFPDGTDPYIINAVWTGSAPSTWDFSTGSVITLTNGNNGDTADIIADIEDETTLTDYVALTGAINLATYDSVRHNLTFQLMLDSVLIGDSVNLNDFIDVGDFAVQQFVIPIGNFNSSSDTFNGLRIVVVRTGGSKPDLTLDDLQLETGTAPLIYSVIPDGDEIVHIDAIRLIIVDVHAGTVTNGTMPGLAFNLLNANAALTNGLIFNWTRKGTTVFTTSFKQLSDFFGAGFRLVDSISDGTDTSLTLEVTFSKPIILNGFNDTLSFTVQDNLSGLTIFNALARGAIVVD